MSGDVSIPHFPPCSALFCLQMLRRVPRVGSVKNYVCISCQTYTPPFASTEALVQAAGTNVLFRDFGQVMGSSLFVAKSGLFDRS
jgi:hypothetical protein